MSRKALLGLTLGVGMLVFSASAEDAEAQCYSYGYAPGYYYGPPAYAYPAPVVVAPRVVYGPPVVYGGGGYYGGGYYGGGSGYYHRPRGFGFSFGYSGGGEAPRASLQAPTSLSPPVVWRAAT